MKTLRPIKKNQGIATAYDLKFQDILNDMIKDYLIDIGYIYQMNPPTLPESFNNIEKAVKEKKDKWDELIWAFILANTVNFVAKTYKATDRSLQNALTESGWHVALQETPEISRLVKILVKDNVDLVKSVVNEFQDKAGLAVTRNFVLDRTKDQLQEDIERLIPKTLARAGLVVRDQSNKINNVIQKARFTQLGITRVMWDHGGAYRKEPRPTHEASTGVVFNLSEGCLIDGEYIQPGEKIGCKCVYRAVLPF